MQLTSTPCATDDLTSALTLENQHLREQIDLFAQQIAALRQQIE